jgi:FkbM family methyltransferase
MGGNRGELKLNLKKIGIDETFVFNTLKEDNGLSRDLDIFGFREPLNWRSYYYFVEESDIVLDIGANLGLFSLLSKKAKKIISVEPINQCSQILKRNLQSNNLKNKSIVVNKAVGKNGNLHIRKDERFNRSSVVGKNYYGATYEVPSETINYFAKKYSTNLLRMDVEGYEYEILKNPIPRKINKISLEFHEGVIGRKKSEKLLRHLDKEGFFVETIIDDLPLRLYPFYTLLKRTGLIKKVSYVKKNLSIEEAMPLIFSGRKIKYLFLKR